MKSTNVLRRLRIQQLIERQPKIIEQHRKRIYAMMDGKLLRTVERLEAAGYGNEDETCLP